MNRLPGTELETPRLEATVFGCLALAGVTAILLATASFIQFVNGRDAIVAALEGAPTLVQPADAALVTPTNVTRIETKAVVTSGRNKV